MGGIETLALVLCREWLASGCEVTVSTDVAEAAREVSVVSCPVHRQPSRSKLWSLWRSHDVVVLMNVSLKAIWPMLLCRTPVVLTHHSPYWIDREGTRDWRERLKVAIAKRAGWNICVSGFVRDAIGLPRARTVPNCYDDTMFFRDETTARDRDVIFVGRLVSDKGADLLLDAVAASPGGRNWSVTIVGGGPENEILKRKAVGLGLKNIRFTGSLSPELVAAELRRHRVIAVPSLVLEAFGIVTLEGMACGVVPVAADGGGLPEAVGDAGVTFRRGDAADLAEKLSGLLADEVERNRLLSQAKDHLRKHIAKTMADAYLGVVREAVSSRVLS